MIKVRGERLLGKTGVVRLEYGGVRGQLEIIFSALLSISVVPNRGDVALEAAVRWCQGCPKIIQYFDVWVCFTI